MRQYLTPTLTESRFHEEGQLTPEEFERAGDYLIRMSPAWSWRRGSTAYLKSYLPTAKQYLVLHDAVCRQRVRDLSGTDSDFDVSGDVDISLGLLPISPARSTDDDEYSDMTTAPLPATEATAPDHRIYEITIAYDNAYRTPRVYLRGFRAGGSPLSAPEMMEDVMQDYVAKTATIESHPHTGEAYLSIHPCRHAQTMRRLVENMIAGGDVPPVELYLFVFLKFISSMIPTIEYDNTMPVSIGSSAGP